MAISYLQPTHHYQHMTARKTEWTRSCRACLSSTNKHTGMPQQQQPVGPSPVEVPQAGAQNGVVQLLGLHHGIRVPLPQLGAALHIRQHQRQGLALACSHRP